MSAFVYLIKKDGFYRIGQVKDIDRQLKKLNPDKIIETIELKYPNGFEARLLRRYQKSRLPDTSYFIFSEKQLIDCKKQFSVKGKLPQTIGADFTIALTGSIFLFILFMFVLFQIKLNLLYSFSIALTFATFPMWFLVLFGDFGGYYCDDLPLFSSWPNRIRALGIASLLSISSYLIFRFT
ncbi:GIY-YIG nuclease family protein [Prochlorococcus marinus]|uniref:GIY-YIG nuclease family protein n=1 Tax=Prochlorococcus marinus TaxID=1219 RepID=UPI0022B2F58E|nr:GIY-YIG nuclease family protein [Prochlorococcus marinus]